MISRDDDGIVVVMDWDAFIEETREGERQMRELAARMRQQNADSRRRRQQLAVRERPPEFPELSLEDRLKTFEADTRSVLSEIRHDLLMLRGEIASLRGDTKAEIAGLRESMATKAELESLKDEIRMVAEGFAHVQTRLSEKADLLRRFLVDSRTVTVQASCT